MKIYKIDSFTETLFGGNPAAICLIEGENFIPEKLMQNIAMENNLSETAFVLNNGGIFSIRWFTPTTEVPLCGHATLAAAHVLFTHEEVTHDIIELSSKSGRLRVSKRNDLLVLDFPKAKIWQTSFNDMLDCFNFKPLEVWQSKDEYLLVFNDQAEIENAICNLEKAKNIDLLGFIITAKSNTPEIDFVSRYFGPKIGIDEDPVTGSAHTLLVPYWKGVLNKDEFTALQVSKRLGKLWCKASGDRVEIGGKAVTFAVGEILL
ncbi:MAG: PhzF family phenazine biosynthesis protein [Defluviitaleaceae bacterium]|nr:PhzF family phenazine biosynthesis protein [Defluviitaleaceae bacterium]